MKTIPFVTLAAAALVTFASTAQAQTTLGGGKGGTSFPIHITQPGHYKLAANLVMPNGGTHGILVQASDVTIDLNGFAIIGPNVCSFQSKTCSVSSPLATGINTYPGAVNITVRNGTVRGFSGMGISAGDGLRVENVTVSHNAYGGISANRGALIDRVIASHNGIHYWASPVAIRIGDGMVTHSTAYYNLGHAFAGGALVGVTADSNNGAAVWAANGYVTVAQSKFTSNAGGHFIGGVHSFGNNFCAGQGC